jgi:CBS domain-containing protein
MAKPHFMSISGVAVQCTTDTSFKYYITVSTEAEMSLDSIPVSSFMTKNVKIETEDQNIQAVCKTMNENSIGSIIVVALHDKGQNPVGIITERDIVRVVGQLNPTLLHMPIKELMSKPLITLAPNNTIKDALQTMQQKDIRRIPIVDKAIIQGIITDKDVFRAIINNKISFDNLVSDVSIAEGHALVFDQCREYFSDVLQKR